MSQNILNQVIRELEHTPFTYSLQLDESTDISQCSQLLVYVRYVNNNLIQESANFFWNGPDRKNFTLGGPGRKLRRYLIG